MPFESEKQRRYMFMHHPDIAEDWVHEAKEHHQPVVRKCDEGEGWTPDPGFDDRLQEIRTQHVPFHEFDKEPK